MAKPLVSDELWQRIEPLLSSTQASSLPVPRAGPLGLPQVHRRHHLRPQDGHPLGGLAPGDGLWLWHDLPELPQCLAAGRGLGEVAPDPSWPSSSRPTSSIGPARSRCAKARALGRRSDRPQSDGSRQTRDQAPCPDRGSRHAAGDPRHRGRGRRRQRVAAAGRRHPAGTPQGGPAPRGVPDNLYADRACVPQPHRQEWRRGGMIPAWRGVGPNTAVAWGSIAGWQSGPCRGCTAFAGSGCGPIERVRSMMPSSHWLQLSYVCGSYDKVFLLGNQRLCRFRRVFDSPRAVGHEDKLVSAEAVGLEGAA